MFPCGRFMRYQTIKWKRVFIYAVVAYAVVLVI